VHKTVRKLIKYIAFENICSSCRVRNFLSRSINERTVGREV